MRGRLSPVSLMLLVAFACTACDNHGRDSLEPTEWHVSQAPILRVGVVDGDPHYQLHQVNDVRRLSDGRIAVANAGSGEVRFYDERGQYLGMGGGSGDGPGEFRSLSSIDVLNGDSLVALDGGNSRISVLDPSGSFVRSWTAESPGRALFPFKIRALGDGSVLISYVRGNRPSDPAGLFRGSAPLVRYTPDGEVLSTVTEIPGDEWYRSEEHGRLSDRPFGHKSYWDVGDGEVYIGTGEAEVLVYSATGELSRRISTEAPEAVTAEHIRAYGDARLQAASNSEAIQRWLAELPYPETFPAYAGLLVDSDGNVWTRQYTFPSTSAAQWTVRNPQGTAIATVSLPSNFEPAFVSFGRIGGVMIDDLGVQVVAVFEWRQKPRGEI